MVALHEKVAGFDGLVLQELLADMYSIEELQVCPAQIGFSFLRRPRRYHVMVNRRAARVDKDIQHLYQVVCHACQSVPSVGCAGEALWRADRQELLAAENEARARHGWPPRADDVGPSDDWTYLLTEQQRGFLDGYTASAAVRRPRAAGHVFDLTQSPMRSAARGCQVPTFRRGSSRCWSTKFRRWLLPRERAAAMGFAVYDDLARAASVPLDEAMLGGPAYTIAMLSWRTS